MSSDKLAMTAPTSASLPPALWSLPCLAPPLPCLPGPLRPFLALDGMTAANLGKVRGA